MALEPASLNCTMTKYRFEAADHPRLKEFRIALSPPGRDFYSFPMRLPYDAHP
jgi:hypothetical protein